MALFHVEITGCCDTDAFIMNVTPERERVLRWLAREVEESMWIKLTPCTGVCGGNAYRSICKEAQRGIVDAGDAFH